MTRQRPRRPLPGCTARVAVLVSISIAGLSPTAMAAETCWTEGPGQFADAVHYCVSSVLPPQGRQRYGPRNLVGYYGEVGAWCEGVRGPGIGQSITLKIDRGPAFRRLMIRNGYGKSAKSYARNGRIRTLRITSNTGINSMVELIDQPNAQPVYLPIIAPHRWVRLEIRSIYPGTRYTDTCVSMVGPDFEYEEELLQSGAPEQDVTLPPAQTLPEPPALTEPPALAEPPPPPPAASPSGGEALDDLPDLSDLPD